MIRVVFVDDEINVLQAMRRAMHCMRGEWNMEFVSSGAEALESLAKAPADVLVCDMRMPGMDGWEVLSAVKKSSPQTVRLVLSGHAEPGSIMRSVGAAHQYLAKPCDSASLKAAIVQIQNLRLLLSNDRLAALVGRVDMLPTAPHIFQELLTCLRNPSSSITDASGIITRDVAMTANIMKLVNSAFFGSRRPISTPERAVAYLGLDTLGALVLGHGVFKSGAVEDATVFSHEQLWQHSLQTAIAARAIAQHEEFSTAASEAAFLAGVLHDVGKMILRKRVPSADQPELSREEIVTRMRVHHAEVGAYLLGLWGFPIPIVEAVALHHTPSLASGAGLGLPAIIHIADRLTHRNDAMSPAAAGLDLESGLLQRLALEDHLPRWIECVEALDRERAAS